MAANAKKNMPLVATLRAVDLSSVPRDVPLPVDLYLIVNNRPVLFRTKGDTLAAIRLKTLQDHKVQSFYIPKNESGAFKDFLAACLKSGGGDHEQRANVLREALFLQLRELEHAEDLDIAIAETVRLFRDTPDLSTFGQSPLARLLSEEAVGAEMYDHSVNVALTTISLATKLLGNSHEVAWKAGLGALLHDVGELRLDERLRGNPDFASKEDWTRARQHVLHGLEILGSIEEVPEEVREMAYAHHETFEGSGYPSGAAGESIPILARIVSACDVYDILTAPNSPRALPGPLALAVMQALQPGRFDPKVLETFEIKA